MKKKIGFIGQGWIGKHYADDFENRGYSVVRYAREKKYRDNQEKIKECDIVFIAVPTPTTAERFDDSIVREVVSFVGDGKTAVIKSTILPGTTVSIQKDYPKKYVMHSPEFLTEVTAAYDAANPDRNVVGIPKNTKAYKERAHAVISVLPRAPYDCVCSAHDAEFIKYANNIWFYFKVIYINMLHDLAEKLGGKWKTIRDSMAADPRVGHTHLDPIHKSGRGAGGHCFIKDFSAFHEIYKKEVADTHGLKILDALKNKNIELLTESGKDLDLLAGVYGKKLKIKKK
jgi:nucleotide sugar dehydrogenase